MASLKDRIKAASHQETVSTVGFRLPKPKLLHYQNVNPFCKAVKDQADNLAMVDAKPLVSLDIDGKVKGTDWHVSSAAFSDMCHFSKLPVRHIKDLARINEALALEVVYEMLHARFHTGQEKCLVIDTRNGRVEGIVGKESYSPINHMDVIDYALSANPSLDFTNGWLSGPNMRMSTAAKNDVVEVKKDDIVRFGTNLENALHGDRSVRVSDYAERLVCTNGMVARDHLGMCKIIHQGDVQFKVQEAVVACADRAFQLVPIMRACTRYRLDAKEIVDVRRFLADEKNGGSPKVDKKATREAMMEAVKEGRTEEEVTLWNFINGTTASAHDEGSLQRKTEIEALGYRTLMKYGAVLVN